MSSKVPFSTPCTCIRGTVPVLLLVGYVIIDLRTGTLLVNYPSSHAQSFNYPWLEIGRMMRSEHGAGRYIGTYIHTLLKPRMPRSSCLFPLASINRERGNSLSELGGEPWGGRFFFLCRYFTKEKKLNREFNPSIHLPAFEYCTAVVTESYSSLSRRDVHFSQPVRLTTCPSRSEHT